jgi:hypothetical protein
MLDGVAVVVKLLAVPVLRRGHRLHQLASGLTVART